MDLRPLLQENGSRILLVVADGLGGISTDGRGTELEVAKTPHLDRLARQGATGLLIPVARGITPGSGPGHLGLFGYDPLEHRIGRGVLTALGIDFDLQPTDVAARGNFCTVDGEGNVVDRRAGRIPSEEGQRLADLLQEVDLEGAEVFVEPVKEHRFLLVLRGRGSIDLGAALEDTDPQRTGVPPRSPRSGDNESRMTSRLVESFVRQARELLAGEELANMVLLRGFERLPRLDSMSERYGVRACALAGYPMYRGIARLLGMEVVPCDADLDSEIDALASVWDRNSFFFLHYKATDSAGEDGDFDRKRRAIEELDSKVPRLLDLRPDVIAVTGDHSTPSQLASHSWHPVPLLLHASSCRQDGAETFGERACALGGLSQFAAVDLMSLLLAHAGRLGKYGA